MHGAVLAVSDHLTSSGVTVFWIRRIFYIKVKHLTRRNHSELTLREACFNKSFILFLSIYVFTFGCVGPLLHRAGSLSWPKSSFSGLFLTPRRFLSNCGAQAPEHVGSRVEVGRLSSYRARA